MNPDLDEVAQDPAAGNIDFFRHIPKKLVESRVGPVWAPNFIIVAQMYNCSCLHLLNRLRQNFLLT